jgi:hypothetical protein
MHTISYFAYLDAGTGSLIIQGLIGLIAGVAVFSRRLIAKATHTLVRMKGGKVAENTDTTVGSTPTGTEPTKKIN